MDARYYACPNCGSKDEDRNIYRCTKCGFEGCCDSTNTREGCWPAGQRCPNCGAEVSSYSYNYEKVGHIES